MVRYASVATRVVVALTLASVWGGALSCVPASAGDRGSSKILDSSLAWPRRHVVEAALRSWECGSSLGLFDPAILTIIDYSMPSTVPCTARS